MTGPARTAGEQVLDASLAADLDAALGLNPLTLIEAGVIPPSATSATTNRQPRATPSAGRRMLS